MNNLTITLTFTGVTQYATFLEAFRANNTLDGSIYTLNRTGGATWLEDGNSGPYPVSWVILPEGLSTRYFLSVVAV